MRVNGDSSLRETASIQLAVLGPQLVRDRAGPSRRLVQIIAAGSGAEVGVGTSNMPAR
jgi:hypothetical protein